MWYTGTHNDDWQIGYSTSADGIVWNKHPANPVLNYGAPGTWEEQVICKPSVVFDGTKYHMWYWGCEWYYIDKIGYATSPDGIAWEKYPGNPVLDVGPTGSWDDKNVFTPFVHFDGTQFHMWYGGSDGSGRRIGYATSSDGIVWNKHPDNPVLDVGPPSSWDDKMVSRPTVLLENDELKMWYTGNAGSNDKIRLYRLCHRTGHPTNAQCHHLASRMGKTTPVTIYAARV